MKECAENVEWEKHYSNFMEADVVGSVYPKTEEGEGRKLEWGCNRATSWTMTLWESVYPKTDEMLRRKCKMGESLKQLHGH